MTLISILYKARVGVVRSDVIVVLPCVYLLHWTSNKVYNYDLS